MSIPTIAVVVPNYNDAGPLRACLDSILQMRRRPDEIIIVDDASTDDSLAVIERMVRDVPTASLLRNARRQGTMNTLNVGLRAATSDYVLFLSSNDYLVDGIFEHAEARLVADGLPGVWSAMVYAIDEQEGRRWVYPSPLIAKRDLHLSAEQAIRKAWILGHWFTGTTLLYRRDALLEIGGFDAGFGGLADMLAALAIATRWGASFTPRPLGVMRMHPGGLMWRTLVDLPGLDAMLERLERDGAQWSPGLFTRGFCDLLTRRIRFTAIRAYPDQRWIAHAASWQGRRYRMLTRGAPYLRFSRPLQLGLAFLALRPLRDALAIIRYRGLRRRRDAGPVRPGSAVEGLT